MCGGGERGVFGKSIVRDNPIVIVSIDPSVSLLLLARARGALISLSLIWFIFYSVEGRGKREGEREGSTKEPPDSITRYNLSVMGTTQPASQETYPSYSLVQMQFRAVEWVCSTSAAIIPSPLANENCDCLCQQQMAIIYSPRPARWTTAILKIKPSGKQHSTTFT